ncbi:hypothetical protein JCM19239_5196 [Vibrio variabilis]|uniref:Uncharacterized protein n=1 Tax=Vibrio variabilis TaxID=990271 RepID=A0ABQ0JD62_9VIBR|nr:hypothetical protein JCM19239_5196 [Vibrio variabilis]
MRTQLLVIVLKEISFEDVKNSAAYSFGCAIVSIHGCLCYRAGCFG